MPMRYGLSPLTTNDWKKKQVVNEQQDNDRYNEFVMGTLVTWPEESVMS